MNPSVTIIIPHWNKAEYLPICLNSLLEQSYPHFEVVLVDNGSTDESLAVLEKDYPWVKVIALEANLGFAKAVNIAIRATRGELVALFNNDVEADRRWLEELVGALERHPEAGMATPKLLLFDRREVINAAGDFYGLDGLPGNRGVWQKDEGQFDEEGWVFGPGGAASLFRRPMLEEIALPTDAGPQVLDEEFVSYCEDVDLAWRAQLADYRCIYAPTALAYHRLSATGGGALASYYVGRNFLYLMAKDYPTSLLVKNWPRILRAQLRIAWEALKAWRGEAARARLCGQIVGLFTWPRMVKKRRLVQSARRVADEYLEEVLKGV
jgi:GT2 family glycosyltransferase